MPRMLICFFSKTMFPYRNILSLFPTTDGGQ
jgi:hypothetical protein